MLKIESRIRYVGCRKLSVIFLILCRLGRIQNLSYDHLKVGDTSTTKSVLKKSWQLRWWSSDGWKMVVRSSQVFWWRFRPCLLQSRLTGRLSVWSFFNRHAHDVAKHFSSSMMTLTVGESKLERCQWTFFTFYANEALSPTRWQYQSQV
jgi:hypothetical protein